MGQGMGATAESNEVWVKELCVNEIQMSARSAGQFAIDIHPNKKGPLSL